MGYPYAYPFTVFYCILQFVMFFIVFIIILSSYFVCVFIWYTWINSNQIKYQMHSKYSTRTTCKLLHVFCACCMFSHDWQCFFMILNMLYVFSWLAIISRWGPFWVCYISDVINQNRKRGHVCSHFVCEITANGKFKGKVHPNWNEHIFWFIWKLPYVF